MTNTFALFYLATFKHVLCFFLVYSCKNLTMKFSWNFIFHIGYFKKNHKKKEKKKACYKKQMIVNKKDSESINIS